MLVRFKGDGGIYAMKMLRKDNIVKRNQVEHTRTERNVLVREPSVYATLSLWSPTSLSLRRTWELSSCLFFFTAPGAGILSVCLFFTI